MYSVSWTKPASTAKAIPDTSGWIKLTPNGGLVYGIDQNSKREFPICSHQDACQYD